MDKWTDTPVYTELQERLCMTNFNISLITDNDSSPVVGINAIVAAILIVIDDLL